MGALESTRGQAKVFIGGISWETTEEGLADYFNAFGHVSEAIIMRDRHTGRSRGFGFVVFSDPASSVRAVQMKHIIGGRLVEAKKAVPREDQRSIHNGKGEPVLQSQRKETNKIFVGGLAPTASEKELKEYFGQFGKVLDVVVMCDQSTGRPRGFGFVTYKSEVAVDFVMQNSFHELKGKTVEVKRAIPKDTLELKRAVHKESYFPGLVENGFAGFKNVGDDERRETLGCRISKRRERRNIVPSAGILDRGPEIWPRTACRCGMRDISQRQFPDNASSSNRNATFLSFTNSMWSNRGVGCGLSNPDTYEALACRNTCWRKIQPWESTSTLVLDSLPSRSCDGHWSKSAGTVVMYKDGFDCFRGQGNEVAMGIPTHMSSMLGRVREGTEGNTNFGHGDLKLKSVEPGLAAVVRRAYGFYGE